MTSRMMFAATCSYFKMAAVLTCSGDFLLCGRNADALDLPFEHDAAVCEHPLADKLTELLNITGRGALIVDEKVTVHLGHMRAAHAKTAAASRVDKFPGAVAWRVFEG